MFGNIGVPNPYKSIYYTLDLDDIPATVMFGNFGLPNPYNTR